MNVVRSNRSQKIVDMNGHARIPGGTYTGAVVLHRTTDELTTRQHFMHGHDVLTFLTTVSVTEAIERCFGPVSGPDTIALGDDWLVTVYYGPL